MGNDSVDMFITLKKHQVVPETPTVFLGTQGKRMFLTPKPRQVAPATPSTVCLLVERRWYYFEGRGYHVEGPGYHVEGTK